MFNDFHIHQKVPMYFIIHTGVLKQILLRLKAASSGLKYFQGDTWCLTTCFGWRPCG